MAYLVLKMKEKIVEFVLCFTLLNRNLFVFVHFCFLCLKYIQKCSEHTSDSALKITKLEVQFLITD